MRRFAGGMQPCTEVLELLLAELQNELGGALELRHRIHAAPELAHREEATAEAIADALGVEVTRAAGTGVIVRTGGEGRAVAVRAELDGLPVEERTGARYAAHNGSMHACGHDVHAAALVALLRAAWSLQDHLPAPLMGVFQPSEEAYPSGAQLLVEGGRLGGAVRAIVAVHVHPDLPWGSLSIGTGPINAACDSVEVMVEGQPAHGAYPHLGRDPILAISSIIVGLHTLLSRRLDPLHPAVLTVGELHAGAADNVIPDRAKASLTVRTHVPADRESLREMIRELVESTARAHGCEGRIETTEGEPVLYNDAQISARAQEIAPAAGFEVAGPWRSCGSDDFSFFGAVAPIAMAFAGLSGAPAYVPKPLHHPEFLPPDEAVAMVARAQAVLYTAAAQA
jgi:amidohydrolase